MKKIVFFLCLSVLIGGLVNGCGSLRPSSINERDDNSRRVEFGHDSLTIQSHNWDVQGKALDYKIKDQSYNIQTKAYSETSPTPGMVDGVIVNRYDNRQIRWVVLRSQNDPDPPLDEVLAPRQTLPVNLPLGQYIVQCYEFTVKGEYLEFSKKLDVKNKRNRGYQGAKYFFVITN